MARQKKASDLTSKRRRYKANNYASKKTPREEAVEALKQMKLLEHTRSPDLYRFVIHTPKPVVIETTKPEKYSCYIREMQRRRSRE